MSNRALIIDDEPALRLLLKLTLSEWQSDEIARGDDALSALKENNDYDLILLDVMLPGLDGWSLAKELVGIGEDTPIIFLTAYGPQAGDIKSDIGLALLPKPFDSKALQDLAKTLKASGTKEDRMTQISAWQSSY